MLNHIGTKQIETERLILRKFEQTDYKDMFDLYCSREKVTEMLTWQAHKTVEDTKAYLENIVLPAYEKDNTYRWAIIPKELGKVIGCIDVTKIDDGDRKAELGWVISDDFWGRGIMPEAATSVLEFLFNLGVERIQAFHQVANPKSGRVMQKIGMQYEGTMKKYHRNNKGELVDCCLYAITK